LEQHGLRQWEAPQVTDPAGANRLKHLSPARVLSLLKTKHFSRKTSAVMGEKQKQRCVRVIRHSQMDENTHVLNTNIYKVYGVFFKCSIVL